MSPFTPTRVRDRISRRPAVPPMSVPNTPRAAEVGALKLRRVSDDVVELTDDIRRSRRIIYDDKRVVRMETSIEVAGQSFERLDTLEQDDLWISAFVEPHRMPRTARWRGQILVQEERGLVNYVTSLDERLYETSEGAIVHEMKTPGGAMIFTWYEWNGRIRSRQIQDLAGNRHFLTYDGKGLRRVRLADGFELERDGHGTWWGDAQPVRLIEVFADASLRWAIDESTFEARASGHRVVRTDAEGAITFTRFNGKHELELEVVATQDENGREKTFVRTSAGLQSIRTSTPRADGGGFDARVIERTHVASEEWRVSLQAPPGKEPEHPILQTLTDDSLVSGRIDLRGDDIVFELRGASGVYVEDPLGAVHKISARRSSRETLSGLAG